MPPRAVNPYYLGVMGMLLLLTAPAPVAASDEPRAVIQGSWIATFGQRQFRGEWSAQALANNANAAVGAVRRRWADHPARDVVR